MPVIHFLNVNEGDCSIIQHDSGHVSVIDVCNASVPLAQMSLNEQIAKYAAARGNYHQKEHPENPIEYLQKFKVEQIFRFISTHPDMDHLDGIKPLFRMFNPVNFWDTANTCEKNDFDSGRYDPKDWAFYKALRDGTALNPPKRLTFYSGHEGKYFNQDDYGGNGDGIYILAPTVDLVTTANKKNDFNDSSYVLLFGAYNKRIIFAGDSHDETWKHILNTYNASWIGNIDLLIAPHHGRKSERSYEFLSMLRPKMTFFGNAKSDYLAYPAWNYRKLPFITNNQAGTIVAAFSNTAMSIYVRNEKYAKAMNPFTFYDKQVDAYYFGDY
jgi:competence protein ComEC